MDKRAAGALLALAACIACTAAAPTAGNHTALDLYEGASDGCYYNFQHYGEGDRIMTNEPCLNCTCHNRMLMCYLRVCPFTKPIGQDCTVEKRADQCCPIVTCPDVPVDLLTSTSTSSPAEYGATGLGKLDKYGCSINGKYFPEGSKVPPTPNKPCEHCYCIRNMTTCVMQECTLHVDGCTPIYHKDVCCPIRYSCDHPEDEVPLLDDMSTTVRPTPGFLLTTTTLSPVTQMSQDCVHTDQTIADGALITTEKACEHCYCMKGDIVCVVQECGAPMENEGKNCTSLPPREGQCCPDTYICEGDELNTDIPDESTTQVFLEKQTTLSPPRRSDAEGSGYRVEPNESAYTEVPSTEPELEGSGEELGPTEPTEEHKILTSAKPVDVNEITEDGDQYIPVTTKAPAYEESETSTKETDNDYISQTRPTQDTLKEDVGEITTGVSENEPHKHVTLAVTSIPESYNKYTTESIDSLNTVPDVLPEKEHEKLPEITPTATVIPISEEVKPTVSHESEDNNEMDATLNPTAEISSTPESSEIVDDLSVRTTDKTVPILDQVTLKEISAPGGDISGTTSTYATSEELETVTVLMKENETLKTEKPIVSTTHTLLEESEKPTTELNLGQNTVIPGEDESELPVNIPEKTTVSDIEVTEKIPKENVINPEEQVTTVAPISSEFTPKSTAEPDKGLNTIPSDTDEQSSSQPSLMEITTSSIETKTTESADINDKTLASNTEKSPIVTSASTLLPEAHVTKADQHTVTTEPSFRKEDEVIFSTEQTKQEFGSTTIKTEFVDEGFIPTSTHDEKLSTGSDLHSTDEDITTIVPEYLEHALVDKTTESNREPSVSSETLPEKVTEAISQPEATLSPTIEITTHATVLPPEVNTYEEPSRIPGEGDCLLNGVTYRNNTIVPSTNNCQTGCKCMSSIIKCDPIICSPPPDYMSNCQSIYDTPESCCPTYICDHPRETIPPQSDNQMSGTEPPLVSPTIECRGDQCELTDTSKPTGPSELCTSADCLSAPNDKTDNECGPDGCGDFVKEPVPLKPSGETQECTDGKCQILPTDSEQPSIKPCNGDDCNVQDEDINKIEIPVTQSATDVNCGSSDCDPSVITPPHENQQEKCNEKDGCKSDDITSSDCVGDKPCRRKDSSITEQLPSKCEGEECVQQTDTSFEEDISKISTTSSTSDKTQLNEVTEKIVPVDEEKLSESTDSPVYDLKIPTSTPDAQYTVKETEEVLEVEKELSTEEPNFAEKESTINPNDKETYTALLSSSEDVTTLKSNIIQNTEENLVTYAPEVVKVDHTDKPLLAKDDQSQEPDEKDQEETTRKAYTDEEITNIPNLSEENTSKYPDVSKTITELLDKSTITEESITKIPEVVKQYSDSSTQIPDIVKDFNEQSTPESITKMPEVVEEPTEGSISADGGTKAPGEIIAHTDIPHLIKEHETEMPDEAERETSTEEESTSTPWVTQEHSDNLTDKPYEDTLITESSTKIPGVIDKHTTEPISHTENPDKSSTLEDQNTEKPNVIEKQDEDNVSSSEEETSKDNESLEVIKDHTDRVPTTQELYTKAPDSLVTQSNVPVFITAEGTETLHDTTEKEPEDKLTTVKEVSTEISQPVEDIIDETTKILEIIKEQTDKTTTSPSIIEEVTDKSSGDSESDNKVPDMKDEHTEVPVVFNERTTKIPHYAGEDLYQTSSPEEHDTTISHDHVDITDLPNDIKEKPILVEEELPEKSPDIKEPIEKKPELMEKDGITEPTLAGESGTESMEVMEDSSKKPTLIDETSPDDIQGNTDELPIVTEQTNTDKSKVKEDEAKDKPVSSEKMPNIGEGDHTSASPEPEYTDKPDISEVHTNEPDSKLTEPHDLPIPTEDKPGSNAPGIHVTQPEKEMKLPESLMEDHTKTTEEESEKIIPASTPAYESQTIKSEETMKPHSVIDDMSVTEKISSSPDAQGQETPITESQEAIPTQEETSQQHTGQQHTGGDDQTTYRPSKDITSENESTEMPETITTTESVEKTTKSTDHEFIQEQEEGSTDVPKQEPLPSITHGPADEITEVHNGEQPKSPSVTQTSTEEEITTKAFEDENIKSSISESHVTPSYEDVNSLPEVDKVTEAVDTETQTGELKPHEGELLGTSTKAPIADGKDDINKNQPDIYTPEKEEMITSAIDATVTTAPFKETELTETEDTTIPIEEHISTKYSEETTERLEQPTTKQIEDSSEILNLSSKTTKIPEEYHTESHEGYTVTPISKETKPSESSEIATPTSTEIPRETSDSKKPVTEESYQQTEIIDLEKTTPAASGAGDTATYEEKTKKTPDSYSPVHSDLTTIKPQMYATSESVPTGVSESLEPASVAPEQTKTTESPYNESEAVDIQKTTVFPELNETPDADTLTSSEEPEVQKSSTELPATIIEVYTGLPEIHNTTAAPLSLVTEPDITVASEKHDDTETIPVPESDTAEKEETEKGDVTTTMHELTPSKTLEVTESPVKATTQVLISETTPYLIELEEHTHKIIDDTSTVSPSIDKEPTYETEADTSTPPSSKDEHIDVHKLTTPSLFDVDHTSKIQEPLPTVSIVEDYTQKVPEDTSSGSALSGEVTTETKLHGVEKVTEKIPDELFETVTKASESTSSSSEESVTTSEITKFPTTLSETKETDAEAKPAVDQEIGVPVIGEGNDGVPQKDITTSKSQEFEYTTPAIVRDTTQKSPVSELDNKVPTDENYTHSHTTTADESIFSPTKATTIKQEELLTPSPEDKYSTPAEKPTSEAVSPSSTAEAPKPSSEMEPTDEIPAPEDEGLSSSVSGYGEPDYAEEDQAFGPGTCRYGGKVYVSAQQIPRDDPCDFCFCFRSDIICLQQSCPPPIHGCHEEPIQGFCCPRYECPVSMATSVNVTTTTTTTTTTLPPNFPTHGYKGAAQRRGCQIKGHTYKVGEVVRSSSGPCLHCTCGGDGQMKCDPKACTPEPMLRQMIAAAVSAKRRR